MSWAEIEQVRVVEVGPRDGLQNESRPLQTADKLRWIEALIDAGCKDVEVGAFVRPDLVPQMADSDAVVDALRERGLHRRANLYCLVANDKGLQRALDAGIDHIAVFTAASDVFARKNIGKSVTASLARFSPIVARATQAGLSVRGYVSTAWWCPFTGRTAVDDTQRTVDALFEMGCEEVSVADTIGAATPREVAALLSRLGRSADIARLAVHFHDTRGTALANVLAALQVGVTSVDASAGGLGGCPFAPGAQGNLATEDLLYMLDGMGVRTDIDLTRLRAASLELASVLERQLPSRYVNAGPVAAE